MYFECIKRNLLKSWCSSVSRGIYFKSFERMFLFSSGVLFNRSRYTMARNMSCRTLSPKSSIVLFFVLYLRSISIKTIEIWSKQTTKSVSKWWLARKKNSSPKRSMSFSIFEIDFGQDSTNKSSFSVNIFPSGLDFWRSNCLLETWLPFLTLTMLKERQKKNAKRAI